MVPRKLCEQQLIFMEYPIPNKCTSYKIYAEILGNVIAQS